MKSDWLIDKVNVRLTRPVIYAVVSVLQEILHRVLHISVQSQLGSTAGL